MKKAAFLFAILILITSAVMAQVNLNLGLKAYYPFSGNANDVSGNNNNPVFNNATLTADRFGNPGSAYHFNGTDNYMRIANSTSLNMPNKMSVALWVKATGYYTGSCYNNMLVTKSDVITQPSNFYVRFADVYNGCTAPTTTEERFSGNNTVAPTPLVQLNQWYSVVWTSDGVLERIYVNCELKVTAAASGVPFSNAFDMFFGKQNSGSFPYWLNGDLDEIRIYDRALNQDEVNTLGGCPLTTSCNNWLSVPSNPSYATAGDIDVTGNQLTVEATVNRVPPLNSGQYYGHIVSKHTGPSNVNYALSLTGCEITTSSGYKFTDPICDPILDKTYHIAMVYNGSTLKFYRNGFLMSSVPCTGNMVTNDLLTTIGEVAGNGYPGDNQFKGFINEVRVWNVARTQAQLQTYMNSSLPNPTTTPGLLGYYTFDNLLNKQGNASYNGVLAGAAAINTTNPNCSFVADSCVVPVTCNNWLRTQAAGQSVKVGDLDVSGNKITVEGNFNCSAFPPPANGNIWEEIVSKHSTPADCNYALRMNLGAITTTNGFFRTPPIPCEDVSLNKTYHAAMVYDGTTLKFYRDGFLRSQIAASGNLVLNNLLTTIGDYADNTNPVGTNFKGYLNEIRIWNVARTQSQIQAYMNASLPNPTTQTGLQGYYTFDNLVNKQGNTTWNGTLNGGATINNTNPNCTFVADSCTVTPPPPVCNSSFELVRPNNSYVRILPTAPVTYNQLYNSNGFSWETWFKLTGPITNLSTLVSTEDAVLFHDIFLGFGWGSIPNALCFLVSDNGSNNATVVAESLQSLTVGTWYHVAAVCDYSNAILRLYLNGNLIATKPIPVGILNDRLTTNVSTQIGNASSAITYGINANIDETRFWNTVRTQAEIQASMNQCLSNPQPGLVAYFKADELAGTTAASAVNNNFSGTLSNTTWGTQTPSVNCGCATATSVIINDYTPVLAFNPCDNKLTVENGAAYNVGDTVLLIQMKGAIIDSTNTATFGTITDYKNAGNYEFNYIKSKTGNIIELKNALTRQYDIPVGRVQLIRVPYYNGSTRFADTLTCLPWDGTKGGVLVLNVRDTVHLDNDINVSGKGFRGAQAVTTIAGTAIFHQSDYAYPANSVDGARKGEGITEVSENLIFCRGPLASGAGGGNSSNSGGGGGGNGGSGGKGGNEWGGTSPIATNGGLGGKILNYSGAVNKIFMGGAGGAGQNNDASATNGGNGGGLIIINANTIDPNAHKIVANGSPGVDCINLATCADGVGGGGAGGSILINAQAITSNFPVQANGGRGANNNIPGPNAHGTGGGAGGGSLLVNTAALLTNISYSATGGAAGIAFNHGNTNWGAGNGNNGISASGFIIPFSSVPFQKNIDSVRIKDSLLSCNDFDFKGLAYVNTNPIVNWQWYFGDGGQANTQNTTHAYSTAGLYTVTLIVTDINGCKDTVLKNVNALPAVSANAGADISVCSNTTVSVTLNGTAVGGPYLWSPAIYLNNPNIQNPTATISSTTTFYLHVNGSATCTAVDSVTVFVNPVPLVDTRPDTAICRLSPLVLTTNSNATTYQWTPAASVSNPTIANPNFISNASGWVYVTGSFASGCSAIDSLYITVNPTPNINTRPDTAICLSSPLILNTVSDATTYQWSPPGNVSNPTIASPDYTGSSSGWVYVTGSFASGCFAKDSLYVTVNPIPLVDTRTDTAICFSSPLILNTNSNATIFQWSPPGNVSNPAIANPNYTGNASGWVYVTGSTAAGCFAKDSLYVTVNPLPVVQTIADTTVCQNVTITLATTGAQTYSWSPAIGLSNPNIASPVFVGNTGQVYNVTGTDAMGCKNTDMLSIIIILPGSFKAPPAFTICQKKSVILDGNNGATVNYLWSPATYLSNATLINPVANPPQTTLYTLVVTDKRCGYDSVFTTLLTVVPAPVINATKSNDIDCAFRSATLFASGGDQYVWTPSTGLNNPNIANPVATPANDQTYIVLVTNGPGCTNTDTVTVYNNRASSLARYMPNAFTPDGDGNNDCYGLKKWMYTKQLQFFVFNRFGEQVFATANPNSCWDGTYKGKPALAGTYVYYIKAQTQCGEEEQKGTFILIR